MGVMNVWSFARVIPFAIFMLLKTGKSNILMLVLPWRYGEDMQQMKQYGLKVHQGECFLPSHCIVLKKRVWIFSCIQGIYPSRHLQLNILIITRRIAK